MCPPRITCSQTSRNEVAGVLCHPRHVAMCRGLLNKPARVWESKENWGLYNKQPGGVFKAMRRARWGVGVEGYRFCAGCVFAGDGDNERRLRPACGDTCGCNTRRLCVACRAVAGKSHSGVRGLRSTRVAVVGKPHAVVIAVARVRQGEGGQAIGCSQRCSGHITYHVCSNSSTVTSVRPAAAASYSRLSHVTACAQSNINIIIIAGRTRSSVCAYRDTF